MAKLAANLTVLDHGYSVQTWCPTLSCAMRVVDEILAVDPDAFGPPPAAHPAVEFEADPVLQALIERSDEDAPVEHLKAGEAYLPETGD
jgi:hypothetical protein